MQKYTSRLTTDGIYKFTELMMTEYPRVSCLAVRILIDIVRNQGDCPADIMERTTGDRDSSSAEKMIKILAQLNLCEFELLSGRDRVGQTARKQVYISDFGAEFLGLKLA